MVWGHTEISECIEMFLRRVSGISVPAVTGVLLRQIHHQPVTPDLRHDRRGGDRGAARIALHDCLGADRETARNAVAVDQEMVGRLAEAGDGAAHGEVACLKDVEHVDFRHAGFGDGHVRNGQNPLEERRAPRRVSSNRQGRPGRVPDRAAPLPQRPGRKAGRGRLRPPPRRAGIRGRGRRLRRQGRVKGSSPHLARNLAGRKVRIQEKGADAGARPQVRRGMLGDPSAVCSKGSTRLGDPVAVLPQAPGPVDLAAAPAGIDLEGTFGRKLAAQAELGQAAGRDDVAGTARAPE